MINNTYMNEIWKDIKGFEGLYKISNLGRVKSMAKEWTCCKGGKRNKEETFMSICTNAQYYNFNLRKNNVKTFCNLHRILAEHFIPNPDNKPEVNHINGNKHDNRLENLEWVTCSENIKHAFDKGLKKQYKRGRHYTAKPIMVIDVKSNMTISFPCVKDASEKMKIGETTIYMGINGLSKTRKYKFQYL